MSTDNSIYLYRYNSSMVSDGRPTCLRFRLERGATLPTRSHDGDAGYDLSAMNGGTIEPGELVMVRTGVHVEAPDGYWLLQAARSSLCLRHHLLMANGVGVVDNGYRGEVMVPLYNLGDDPVTIEPGERIAQLVLVPMTVPEPIGVARLSDSDRGDDGYGSTGAM